MKRRRKERCQNVGNEDKKRVYTERKLSFMVRKPRQGLMHRFLIKTKGGFPNGEAVRKLLFLATRDITKKWTMPIFNWAAILNQLVIRFEDRLSL
jgi:hypothetical protein